MYFCNMIFRHLLNMRSHPTWVRGLKHYADKCRRYAAVAPYVGAWIETKTYSCYKGGEKQSHPTWVRGLKQIYKI